MYVLAFVAVFLIYFAFKEEAKGTFFGEHAFIHIVDVAMFALLLVGAGGVYFSQAGLLGRVAKAGLFLTLAGFGLGVAGGLTIIVVGLAVGDEATLGVLDIIAHPLSQLLYTLGSAIFGVALLRKGTLPKVGALLVAVGPVALFALFMTGNQEALVPIMACVAATGLGWAMLGIGLRAERAAPSGREEIAAGPAPAAR
jgi:membrane-associated HD superfamily phosphohydrolase